jgi:hypothetical protein
MPAPGTGARLGASVWTPFGWGFAMMMEGCVMGMMVMMWAASLLSLGLLATLIVLLWVVIGRLRRNPTWPLGGAGTGRQ